VSQEPSHTNLEFSLQSSGTAVSFLQGLAEDFVGDQNFCEKEHSTISLPNYVLDMPQNATWFNMTQQSKEIKIRFNFTGL